MFKISGFSFSFSSQVSIAVSINFDDFRLKGFQRFEFKVVFNHSDPKVLNDSKLKLIVYDFSFVITYFRISVF